MLWSPGIWGGDGCEWGSLLGAVGMQTLMSHSCGHVFIHRPQKDLGMDEEGVRQPPGPPARKKFFIPLDEDAVPPAGVGRGDERNAARPGARGVGRKGPRWPQHGLGYVGPGVTLGNSTLLCTSLSFSV